MLYLFVIGALSVLAQVVLLRELNVAFFGVELAYVLALAAWLTGTATGALLLPRRLAPSAPARAAVLAIVAASLPLEVAAIRASRRMLGGLPGAFLPVEQQALVLAAAVLPPAILLGLSFRWAAQVLPARGSRLARGYAVESLGAAFSGLAATLAFAAGVQTFALAVATGTAGLAVAAVAAAPRRARVAAGVAGAAVAALAVTASAGLDASLTRLNHPALTFSSDSPYGRITVTSVEGQRAVFENDVLVHESGSREQEALAHLAALQHPSPGRRLVLGGTLKGLDELLAAHGPGTVAVVEMDPVVADLWHGEEGPDPILRKANRGVRPRCRQAARALGPARVPEAARNLRPDRHRLGGARDRPGQPLLHDGVLRGVRRSDGPERGPWRSASAAGRFPLAARAGARREHCPVAARRLPVGPGPAGHVHRGRRVAPAPPRRTGRGAGSTRGNGPWRRASSGRPTCGTRTATTGASA